MIPVLLQNLDWLIQPEALRFMALVARSFNDRGTALPQPRQSNPLHTAEDGIGTVSIARPPDRKPKLIEDRLTSLLAEWLDRESVLSYEAV